MCLEEGYPDDKPHCDIINNLSEGYCCYWCMRTNIYCGHTHLISTPWCTPTDGKTLQSVWVGIHTMMHLYWGRDTPVTAGRHTYHGTLPIETETLQSVWVGIHTMMHLYWGRDTPATAGRHTYHGTLILRQGLSSHQSQVKLPSMWGTIDCSLWDLAVFSLSLLWSLWSHLLIPPWRTRHVTERQVPLSMFNNSLILW